MSTRSGPPSRPGRDPEPDGAEEQSAFAAMLDEHEGHVFDYVSRLIGDEAEAVSATETAMNAAQSLLADPDRLRAWLFAMARQEIATRLQPPDQDKDAEIRDLVHRHGIKPQDLPAVLGVSAEQAQAMLAEAEAEIDGSADMAKAMLADAEAQIDGSADMAQAMLADADGEIDGSADMEASAEPDVAADTGAPDQVAAPVVAGATFAAGQLAEVGVAADLDVPADLGVPADLDVAADLDERADDDEPAAAPPSWIWDRTAASFIDDSDTDPRGIPAIEDSMVDDAALAQAPALAGAGAGPPAFARARRRLGFSAIFVAFAGGAVAAVVYLGGSPAGQADTHGGAQQANTGSAVPAVSSPASVRHTPRVHSRTAPKHHHRTGRVAGPFPAQPTSVAVPVTSTSNPAGVLTPPTRHKHRKSGHSSPPPTIAPSPTPDPSPTTPSTTPSP